MKASDRIARGFFRLGLLGAIVAAPVVLFHSYLIASSIMQQTRTVHYEGRWITVKTNATPAEAEEALRKADAVAELPDALDMLRASKLRGGLIEERARGLLERAREYQRTAFEGSTFIIALALAASALWFGLCRLVSWVVRGFLI